MNGFDPMGPVQKTIVLAPDDIFPVYLRFYWEPKKPSATWCRGPSYWIDFGVFEVAARNSKNDPEWYSTEKRELCDGMTADIESAMCDAHGFVKWDGCTQIYFPGDGGPSLHYDDRKSLARFLGAIIRAQRICYDLMDVDGAMAALEWKP